MLQLKKYVCLYEPLLGPLLYFSNSFLLKLLEYLKNVKFLLDFQNEIYDLCSILTLPRFLVAKIYNINYIFWRSGIEPEQHYKSLMTCHKIITCQ